MNLLKKLRISSSMELNIGAWGIWGLFIFVPNIIYLPHSVAIGLALFACMISTHGFIRSRR